MRFVDDTLILQTGTDLTLRKVATTGVNTK